MSRFSTTYTLTASSRVSHTLLDIPMKGGLAPMAARCVLRFTTAQYSGSTTLALWPTWTAPNGTTYVEASALSTRVTVGTTIGQQFTLSYPSSSGEVIACDGLRVTAQKATAGAGACIVMVTLIVQYHDESVM